MRLRQHSLRYLQLALVLTLFLNFSASSSFYRVREVRGDLSYSDKGVSRIVRPGTQLRAGDTVLVNDSVSVELLFNNVRLVADPESRFVFVPQDSLRDDHNGACNGVVLISGNLLVELTPKDCGLLFFGERGNPVLKFEGTAYASKKQSTEFRVFLVQGAGLLFTEAGRSLAVSECWSYYFGSDTGQYFFVPPTPLEIEKLADAPWNVDISCSSAVMQESPDQEGGISLGAASSAVKTLVDPPLGPSGTEFKITVEDFHKIAQGTDRFGVRWDVDNDGTWDFPPDSSFTTSHALHCGWNAPGRYVVSVQVRDSQGNTAGNRIPVIVTKELEVDEIVSSDTLGMGAPETFTCHVLYAKDSILDYSWDFDGDGAYDTVTSHSDVSHIFFDKGAVEVSCMARDRVGRTSKVSRTLYVGNAPTFVDAMGPYRVQVNSPLSVVGRAEDLDNAIISYSWDFDGDRRNDWTSTNSSRTQYSFPVAGEYTILLSVRTDDGNTASDSAVVTVFNVPPKAYAGEDVISKAGKPVLLMGTARDPDGRIVGYEWDFDGDGTFDWSSPDTGYVSHTFETFSSAVLRVQDSDGAMTSDTLRIVICPEDMVPVGSGRFCIDPYEWPNKKGEEPGTEVSYEQAERLCKKQGKRLCTPAEWQAACGGIGDRRKIYPYGNSFAADNCNTFGNNWTRNSIAESGRFNYCKSGAGVFDMSGNVAEWTYSDDEEYAQVYGGFWQSNDIDSRCESRVQLEKKRSHFYVGFRCCK